MLYEVVRGLSRHYPLNSPRASLLRILPDVPERCRPFRIKQRLVIDDAGPRTDLVARSLFWFGDFDPWVGDTLARLVRVGETACDIGANIGAIALPLARLVGATGQVFCFEPAPPTAQRLERNVAASGLRNITLEPIALSDADGSICINVPEAQPGKASLGRARDGGYLVATRRFDGWRAEHGVDRIAACKIDVEGHEPAVLQGMEESLAEGRIGAILFEQHPTSASDTDATRWLTAHGYRVYQIFKGLFGCFYGPPGASGLGMPTSDYVAARPDTDAERRLLER